MFLISRHPTCADSYANASPFTATSEEPNDVRIDNWSLESELGVELQWMQDNSRMSLGLTARAKDKGKKVN